MFILKFVTLYIYIYICKTLNKLYIISLYIYSIWGPGDFRKGGRRRMTKINSVGCDTYHHLGTKAILEYSQGTDVACLCQCNSVWNFCVRIL